MASNLEKVINIAKEISGGKTSVSFNDISLDNKEPKPEQLSLFQDSCFELQEKVFLSEIARFDSDGKIQKIKVKVFEPSCEDDPAYLKITGKIFETDIPELIGYLRTFEKICIEKEENNN